MNHHLLSPLYCCSYYSLPLDSIELALCIRNIMNLIVISISISGSAVQRYNTAGGNDGEDAD
jgi:hypothetical protein